MCPHRGTTSMSLSPVTTQWAGPARSPPTEPKLAEVLCSWLLGSYRLGPVTN